MLTGTRILAMSEEDFIQRMENYLTLEFTQLKGKRTSPKHFSLWTERQLVGLSSIDSKPISIDLRIASQDEKNCSINYRIRGDSTYSVVGIMLLFGFLPIVLITVKPHEAAHPNDAEVWLLWLFLLGLVGILVYFMLKSRRAYERKGEKLLLNIFQTLNRTG